MQTAIFKFLALSGVIALGCFVVYQVHTRIPTAGQQPATPEDFQTIADKAGVDADSGTPEADAGIPDPLAQQREPETASQLLLTGETPAWQSDAVPVQTEPEPTAESVPVSEAFWSEDPAALSADDPAAGAPELHTVQADEPREEPESPWLSNDPSDSVLAADAADAAEAIVPVAHDVENSDPVPRTLTPLGHAQPLPGAFIPDDEDWSPEEPSEAVADAELLPIDAVAPLPQSNPLAMPTAASAREVQEPDDLPLLDFQVETDPARDADVVADPFSGFTEQPSQPAPVLPADPSDAGFTEFEPVPTPPPVASDPFAFPADADDSADEPVPPARESESIPEFREFDAPPMRDDAEIRDDPGSSSPVLPLTGFGELDPEPGPAPRLPVRSDDGPSDTGTDSTPNPFSPIPDDEEHAPENASPDEPFAVSPTPRPESRTRGTDDSDSAMARDLVGDATVDRESASGSQQPELQIEKIAPPEATVGSPLIYAIHIRNVGRSAARGVVVEDRIPRGTILEGTIPQAELTDKVLTWRLGTIAPGQEETIRIKVTPTEAGEIGSVATVRFAAEVSAATSITSADLRLQMDGPREVALGETAVFHYTLTNAGDGPARGAYIRCLLPPAFEHPGGADIEYEVGDLQPGESSDVDLEVRAVEAGTHQSRVLLNANGRTHDEAELSVNVLPSRLLISREGPARRFVGRSARYSTVVTNRSGVELTGISVVEQLPAALEPAAIPEDGTYDRRDRTITWTIPRLAAGASYTIDSTVVAREHGLHSSTIIARDRAGNEAHVTSDLQVAGFSTLEVDWEHDGKPVAVGEQVAMRLTIRNEGTAPAQNVQAVFEVPPQMEFVNAQGPVPYLQEGRLIRFEGLDELSIDGEQSFDIVLTAAAPGNTKVSAELRTADHTEPLRHDEPLFILQDEN